ncbi:tRNA (uridine(54)-C5)-methyltransferase TrmA [Echinimonas agarilytica]|uniref:tRNA/tmRNA (uracil-C(5))-methyltransferase n=1 Tax=Echinimonas agarilytica TaxID=1215918 RepID=A0AA41W7U1_9GAMM|nr:tRNA (uridine(54)-C5)-methyltransferase TrmA [Echinimonas agarilytica]MCM2680877.1 tRNA (uridine(54)-C5)-methyltransferase TrmA [Echinimonas agarilytica]
MANTIDYQQQLQAKAARITQQFADLTHSELEVFDSVPSHYRMRAEFRVWHEGDDIYHIMFNQETKQKYRVDAFPTASKLINDAMPRLLDLIRDNRSLRHKLFQVDYLSSQQGELLISMLYHKQLDDEWQKQAQQLQQRLSEFCPTFIIGRARKQKMCLSRDYVNETLNVHGRQYVYRHVENSFTQPNAVVCEKMLEWAIDCTRDSKGDLLELYCGNGNFSIPMSQNFNQVLATEIAKPSVDSAQINIAANKIDNLQIVRLSSEEFTEAWTGKRKFKRLADIDLEHYELNTLFVDPPRSGLDEETREMAKNFQTVIYISCNPDTLYRDLDDLKDTYTVQRLALFDQFPFTHHAEMGVLLERNA